MAGKTAVMQYANLKALFEGGDIPLLFQALRRNMQVDHFGDDFVAYAGDALRDVSNVEREN